MSSIQKRPNGVWRARYRDAAKREHARHFRRKIDAQRWLDSVASQMLSGTYVDPSLSKVTVGAWSRRWLAGQVQLKASTANRYEGALRVHVLPTWEHVPLSAVKHADVSEWVGRLSASGLSGSSVRHAHRVLSLVLDLAVRDGRIPRNPAERVRLPRANKPEKRFLTHAQVNALAEAAGEDGLVIRLLAYCGLRFGELAALRVKRLDLVRGRMVVAESVTEVSGVAVFGTPKTHQVRTVPIPRSLLPDLAEHVEGKEPEEFVFTSPEGQLLRIGNWRTRVFFPAARRAGLDGLTPHELRHTAASLAVSAGANIKAVQRLLGHASAAMTLDVYSGLFEDDLQDVADRLDAAARGLTADSGSSDRVPGANPEGRASL
ncbi:tyrosine-type recombinase/integrase [Thalassiella azotivora]